MTTQSLVKKLNNEVADLRKDVSAMKQLFLEITGDPEGEYRARFVKKVLNRAKEKPRYRFISRASFIKHLYGGTERN